MLTTITSHLVVCHLTSVRYQCAVACHYYLIRLTGSLEGNGTIM